MIPDLTTLVLFAVIIVSVIGVALSIAWLIRLRSSLSLHGRISNYVQPPQQSASGAYPAGTRMVVSKEDLGKFQVKISSAYWQVSDTEFILIRILITVLGFVFGWVIPGNILGGVFLGAIAFMVPPILLDRAISQRQRKFHEQLLDVLIMIKGAVQAGYSLMQALDFTVEQVNQPSAEEYGRVLREVRFGIPLEQALLNLAERMENDDLQIVVTAIIINTQVGGNLSTVLEATISTIRDRLHLFGEIKSLSAYARYVGNFLTLMPFITGLVIFIINPGYFDTVKTELFTQVALVMALIGVFVGNIWIRNIVRIRV